MAQQFISGVLFAGFIVSALFFFRFWRKTRDRLFLMFSISFLLFGVERLVISFVPLRDEFQFSVYCIRLIAFLLLIFAILDKNRQK